MHPIIYSMVYTVFCTYKLGVKFPFFFFFECQNGWTISFKWTRDKREGGVSVWSRSCRTRLSSRTKCTSLRWTELSLARPLPAGEDSKCWLHAPAAIYKFRAMNLINPHREWCWWLCILRKWVWLIILLYILQKSNFFFQKQILPKPQTESPAVVTDSQGSSKLRRSQIMTHKEVTIPCVLQMIITKYHTDLPAACRCTTSPERWQLLSACNEPEQEPMTYKDWFTYVLWYAVVLVVSFQWWYWNETTVVYSGYYSLIPMVVPEWDHCGVQWLL